MSNPPHGRSWISLLYACLFSREANWSAIGYIDNIAFPGVTLVIESQDIGLATGVLGSLRALGGAVAQALYTSVLNNELEKNIPKYVSPAVTSAGLPKSSLSSFVKALAGGSSVDGIPGVTNAVVDAGQAALKIAYARSFRIVFFCTIPFSVILITASIFVPNMESFLNYNVAKRLQSKEDAGSDEKPGVEPLGHSDPYAAEKKGQSV